MLANVRASIALATLAVLPGLPASAAAQQDLLVSGYSSQAVHRYDAGTGASLGLAATAPGAQSLRYGPDGFLYACAEEQDRVLRLDGSTGAFVSNFVWDDPATPADESGGLDAPTAAVFGADGALYVASFSQDRVLRYDGATGALIGEFVAPGSGALDGPDAGMGFGPDGRLYVPSFNNDRVLRYEADTGAFVDAFVVAAEGLSRPRMLRWRGDGLLYVTSWGNNRVLRFDLAGAPADASAFVTGVTRPTGLVLRPDDGDLLTTSDQTNNVRIFDGLTGAAKGPLVTAAGSGGLVGGTFLEFLPDVEFHFERLEPGSAGGLSALDLSGGTPGSIAFLIYGFAAQSQQAGPCAHAYVGVQPAAVVPVALDGSGRFHLDALLPASLAGVTLFLQAFDPATCRPTNLVIQEIAPAATPGG
jgi:sugar lactone lactonase YvrE